MLEISLPRFLLRFFTWEISLQRTEGQTFNLNLIRYYTIRIVYVAKKKMETEFRRRAFRVLISASCQDRLQRKRLLSFGQQEWRRYRSKTSPSPYWGCWGCCLPFLEVTLPPHRSQFLIPVDLILVNQMKD